MKQVIMNVGIEVIFEYDEKRTTKEDAMKIAKARTLTENFRTLNNDMHIKSIKWTPEFCQEIEENNNLE